MSKELHSYNDILFGRATLPGTLSPNHVESLMEFASTVFSRAKEMEMRLHKAERDGDIARGSLGYKFRTGELRAFQELSKAASELGSRRITLATHDGEDYWQ
jgi:hypothetical protein